MAFGNILGQMLQQGLAGQQTTRNRVGHATDRLSRDQGVEQILGRLQSALGSRGAARGTPGAAGQAGGFADAAGTFLGNRQAGGMTGAQIGGLGALAGAVLGGGGLKGAARGGAMALLGTLALNAIRQSRAGGGTAAAAGTAGGVDPQQIDDAEVIAVTSEAGERLAVRAMIAAAKADGHIDQTEMDRILGKLEGDEVTPEERRFVLDELRRPSDPADLAREATSPAQAAEIYAASLLAIEVDSDAERDYLRRLAQSLDLDAAAVAYLHESTGAPKP